MNKKATKTLAKDTKISERKKRSINTLLKRKKELGDLLKKSWLIELEEIDASLDLLRI